MKYWFNLLIKSQGSRLYWGILWAALTMLSGLSLLMLSGWFITATALAGIAISAGLLLMFDMYMPGSGIRFFALSRTIGRYTERIYNHDTVLRLIAAFRVSIFKELMRLPTSQLRASSDSEWLGKLTADLDALDSILLRYTIVPIASLIVIVILTLFLSFVWFELAFYLGGFFMLLYLIGMRITIIRSKHFATASSQLLSNLRAEVIGHLQGAFELQSYQLMQHHEQRIVHCLEALGEVQRSLNSRVANVQWLLNLTLGLALLVLVFVALYSVNAKHIDGPIAVLLVMMFIGITEVLASIPSQFSTWGNTSFAAKRLNGLFAPTQKLSGEVITEITSISVRLNQQIKIPLSIAHSVVLSSSASQLHLILGRSGAGKSSIANLLSGLEPLDSNASSILINGDVPLQDINQQSWHACLGYLEQSNTILSGSLGYNLGLGLKAVSEEQIWSVLKMVELYEWAVDLPQGLNTWLGETGGAVSGGQARRICLARLLLREPHLLVLDEPFNGIDHQMANRIWDNMSDWLAQRLVILLTHEQPEFLSDIPPQHVLSLNIN